MRVLSPNIDPPVYEEDGSIVNTAKFLGNQLYLISFGVGGIGRGEPASAAADDDPFSFLVNGLIGRHLTSFPSASFPSI